MEWSGGRKQGMHGSCGTWARLNNTACCPVVHAKAGVGEHAWLGKAAVPAYIGAGSGPHQTGPQHPPEHENQISAGELWAPFSGTAVSAGLHRARGGNEPNQAGPWNSPDENTLDTHGSQS